MNKLEKILNDKRVDLGLSKKDFVEKELKISYRTYLSLVKKIREPRMSSVVKVAKYLKISNSKIVELMEQEV